MDNTLLERYYETVILPLYGDAIKLSEISWKDHGKVGQDSWAHYFEDESGREYVLMYEDSPGNDYLDDGLTHDIVKCGDQTSVQIVSSPERTVDNVVGHFTLYAERVGR